MNTEKRKRQDGHKEEETKKKKKKREKVEEIESEERVVREEEVEEFFAILKRIHVAVKYFQKPEGSGPKLTAKKMNSWRPAFKVEDFEEDDGIKDGAVGIGDYSNTPREDPVEENLGLDLNSEPILEVEHNII